MSEFDEVFRNLIAGTGASTHTKQLPVTTQPQHPLDFTGRRAFAPTPDQEPPFFFGPDPPGITDRKPLQIDQMPPARLPGNLQNIQDILRYLFQRDSDRD